MKPMPHLAVALAALPMSGAWAQNCAGTGTGRVPIPDLGSGLYLNQFSGGLYPEGANEAPLGHRHNGRTRALATTPLDVQGMPSPEGKIVMISVGMSNTTQEFCNAGQGGVCSPETFMGQAAVHPEVNHSTLVILDGARGGQAAGAWTSPQSPNYNRIRDMILAPRGLSEQQVQIVWVKQANPSPSQSLPDAQADAYVLLGHLGNITRSLKIRYPNVQQVYFSSRIYAGYATTGLNPEPYAYETGFAVKWLIESQIRQRSGLPLVHPFNLAGDLTYDGAGAVAPWIAWGPYLWADGLNPRGDGLIWECADFANDGTHPAHGARQKVGTMLMDFFLSSPLTKPWFRADGGVCYADCDSSGELTVDDFTCFINEFAAAHSMHGCLIMGYPCYANCDGSTIPPILTVDDFTCFVNEFAMGCP